MAFDPDYARILIEPIQQGIAIGTYTVEERVANWDNPYARCWNLEEGWEAGKRFPPNPPRFGTDFRAILKSEFEKAGGFDSIGYTDTWTLFQKLGVRPLATRAVCYHRNPSTLREILHQARWSAKRPYKFGLFGNLFALVRASLPVSVLIAASGTIRHANFAYFPFKLTYDFGRFIGILEYLLTGKLTK
jgi:hypothetical protein